MSKQSNKSIAVDFDGVIHRYSKGYDDGTIYDEPIPGAIEGIQYLQKMGFAVFILSTRAPEQIKEWMDEKFPELETAIIPDDYVFFQDTQVLGITNKKLPAKLYIDDNALPFGSNAPIKGMLSWADVVMFAIDDDIQHIINAE